MLGYDENGNIDWNEVMDMEFEQAQGSKEQIIERMHKQAQEREKEPEEMTEQEHFDMKADLDYDQMIDDSLTD